MTFGQIIKDLRHKSNMTQEQLAEILSISGQAVSRWENDNAMPDISILPAIANLFDVSCDYLLGVDISRKEEKINQIIQNAQKYEPDNYKEAVDLLRDGLKEYPRSYRLMHWLIVYLELYASGRDDKQRVVLLQEMISYGEKILDGCTNETIRFSTINHLCQGYTQINELDKARRLIDTLPDIWAGCNRQTMLSRICCGQEQFDAKRDALAYHLSQAIIGFNNLNTELDNGELALSPAEEITMYENVLALITILFPDNNCGTYFLSKIQAYKSLSFLHFKQENIDQGIHYLKNAVEDIVSFENGYDEKQVYTSLLMRGKEYGLIHFKGSRNLSLSAGLLDTLKEQSFFIKIKENAEVKKLCKILRKQAGK